MAKRLVLGFAAIILAACATVGADDFKKGTLGASLSLAGSSVEKSVQLPAGNVQLVFAIRDYMCRPPNPNTVLRLKLAADQGVVFDTSVHLKDLTWAHAVRSCHAYGYLYDESAGLAKLRFNVPGDMPQAFKLAASIEATAERRGDQVDLWFIYNGRAPTTEMFGTE